MAPIGGEMLGCKLASKQPTVIAEMIFVEREGADNVIEMFNNKKVGSYDIQKNSCVSVC